MAQKHTKIIVSLFFSFFIIFFSCEDKQEISDRSSETENNFIDSLHVPNLLFGVINRTPQVRKKFIILIMVDLYILFQNNLYLMEEKIKF